jgi:hypothetical protein
VEMQSNLNLLKDIDPQDIKFCEAAVVESLETQLKLYLKFAI